MFKVNIDVSLKVKDCPEGGLGAVDFRKANGLTAVPTNEVRVKFEGANEELCRKFADLLDGDADLILTTGGQSHCRYDYVACHPASVLLDSKPGYGGSRATYHFAVPAPLLVPFVEDAGGFPPRPTPDHAAALLRELRRQADSLRADREAERKARDAAEAERKAERERAGAERKAEEAAWIAAHGSARLKAYLAGGFDHCTMYLDERVAFEIARDFPSWVEDTSDLPAWDASTMPTDAGLALFAAAKATVPDRLKADAELVSHEARTGDEDECGNAVLETRYAVSLKPFDWCGRRIVYGYEE